MNYGSGKMTPMNDVRDTNFYMANLGSELIRMISARDKGDKTSSLSSAERCLSLIEKALDTAKSHLHRQEISILKDIVEDAVSETEHKYSITKKEVESYFYPFALRFMKQRQE